MDGMEVRKGPLHRGGGCGPEGRPSSPLARAEEGQAARKSSNRPDEGMTKHAIQTSLTDLGQTSLKSAWGRNFPLDIYMWFLFPRPFRSRGVAIRQVGAPSFNNFVYIPY